MQNSAQGSTLNLDIDHYCEVTTVKIEPGLPVVGENIMNRVDSMSRATHRDRRPSASSVHAASAWDIA